MKTLLAVIGTLALCLGACVCARADDRSEIADLYAKLEAALRNKTPETTLALETADFTSRTGTGKPLNGKELVQQMRQQNARVKSVDDVKIAVKRVIIKGKTAKVTTDFSYAVTVMDKEGHMGPKGGTHAMAMSGLVTNDLVKTSQGWKFKSMQSGTGKMLIDGQPVSQPAPGTTRPVRRR